VSGETFLHGRSPQRIAELSGALAEFGVLFGDVGFERPSRGYFRDALTLATEAGDTPAETHVQMGLLG
jgi:hypothetical protein